VCCNLCVVEIFGGDQSFLWMTTVWGGDIALDQIFHEESLGDVSKSLGYWLLRVFEHVFITSPDLD